jgi:hypothetical protein
MSAPKSKWKYVHLNLVVKVPVGTTPKSAALEVRTLIDQQCSHTLEPEEIRVRRCRPAPRRDKETR